MPTPHMFESLSLADTLKYKALGIDPTLFAQGSGEVYTLSINVTDGGKIDQLMFATSSTELTTYDIDLPVDATPTIKLEDIVYSSSSDRIAGLHVKSTNGGAYIGIKNKNQDNNIWFIGADGSDNLRFSRTTGGASGSATKYLTISSGTAPVADFATENSVTLKFNKLNIPTASGGSTYGAGTSGQVLTSNGTTVYWGSASAINDAGSSNLPVYISGGSASSISNLSLTNGYVYASSYLGTAGYLTVEGPAYVGTAGSSYGHLYVGNASYQGGY